ncbi:hypothetical protein C6A37_05025 [Desulfobacteraceae bacterium SEEP-SAG9]|nr:hypothetical protein C6A37_05025 [Desulfobacteraceae bacterium SEEP-SAG9]
MVMGKYFLIIFCVLCGKTFFISPDTKSLRKNDKIKSFMSLCLGDKYFWFRLVQVRNRHGEL